MLTKTNVNSSPSRKSKVREAIQIAHLLQRKPGTNPATKAHELIVCETGHKIYITFRHSTMTKNKFLQCM
jgi:hypothetical protein